MRIEAHMDKVKKFLKVLQIDPNAQRLARRMQTPESDEEAVDGYVRLAETLGFDISHTEMAEGLQTLAKEQHGKTARTEKRIGRISEEELEDVSGGSQGAWYPAYCKDQFVEGQWCWYADSCAQVINYYDDVIGGRGK